MFKQIAVAALFTISASSAIARDDTSGKYAGIELGRADLSSASAHATSVGAFAGYRFNRQFAIEGALHRLGNFEFDNGPRGTVNKVALGVLGTVPVSDKAGIYGRAGWYYMNGDRSALPSAFVGTEKSGGLVLGVGASYAFTAGMTARVEMQRTISASGSDWNNVSAGMVFAF